MIDRAALLSDLQKLLQRLEPDLLERSESADVPEVGMTLRAEYDRAKTAERTAQNYEDWRTDAITQAAAAWVLSCVFVRFLEDNRLIDPPKIAGPDDRLERARDEHELYFRSHPKQTDREYLLAVFEQLAKLPGTKDVFGEHNPIRELPNWLSGDAAGEMLRFFQKIDANTGALVHDFTDTNWDTRFLGDLYQDLSEAARKKYALLQTPVFVEEFILDRTLNPALDEFGLDAAPVLDRDGKPLTEVGFRMIDPACGSGHFLLGAFPRVLDRWLRKEPATNMRALVQRALDSIHGVDINPYAVAIARFRLLLAAMRASNITRLDDCPAFKIHLVCGDSLYHGRQQQLTLGEDWTDEAHYFRNEDASELRRILKEGTYHSVVANPPYITPKDRAANEGYRKLYPKTCHMKYSLAVPFMEQIFRLSVANGYTGQLTTNSFMKREFGKKLIEAFFPSVDLTHVIDTSGAYIPGCGTPTVILFGRHRPPMASTLRTVMGIRGEPSTPGDPARGLVWLAIIAQLDQPGSQSEFVSVGDSERVLFHKHPWSIGGGGASELKELLDEGVSTPLSAVVDEIGILGMTNADEVMLAPRNAFVRKRVEPFAIRRLALGDEVRDWEIAEGDSSLFPYRDGELIGLPLIHGLERWLWPCRTVLGNRVTFARLTYFREGRPWWEWHQVTLKRLRTPLSIVFSEIATHNHFVLDRDGKVFNRTAPVIKLPREASEDDHLALLGLLNSSTACFWMKQVAHQKQMMGGDGIRIESKAKAPYAFSGTQLAKLPIPEAWKEGALRERLLDLTRRMDRLALRLSELTSQRAIESDPGSVAAMRETWQRFQVERLRVRSQMVLLQEEIDFTIYTMWDFADRSLLSDKLDWPEVTLDAGDRPFDIQRGRNEDDFPVPNGIPAAWPADLRDLWQRRTDAISKSSELRLIEDPHYKRRWIGRQGLFNHTRNKDELDTACTIWLLDRLESYFDFDGRMKDSGIPTAKLDIVLNSVAQLADVARHDVEFMQVGELFRNDAAFDVQALVAELVDSASVPCLPILRYKPSGLRKYGEWEQTWDLQRREDAGESVDLIPVPPKYEGKDFLKSDYNRLRGKLDVPKERWISFPHCEGPDGTLVIAWAGYDHLQQARAISAYYVRVQTEFGGTDDARLIPLLACLIELLPWLKQWHNEPDAAFDAMRMGDFFEGFVNEEARQLNKTIPEIKAWTPPARTSGRGRRRTSP
ncbi:MAG: BREX-2 system adenine-specific DNA-methyltransferase PglX [Planctomycetaceae bacterium]